MTRCRQRAGQSHSRAREKRGCGEKDPPGRLFRLDQRAPSAPEKMMECSFFSEKKWNPGFAVLRNRGSFLGKNRLANFFFRKIKKPMTKTAVENTKVLNQKMWRLLLFSGSFLLKNNCLLFAKKLYKPCKIVEKSCTQPIYLNLKCDGLLCHAKNSNRIIFIII